MYVWMKISDDKYELPEAVADSQKELAAMLGLTPNNLAMQNKHRKDRGLRPLYIKVDIGNCED